ncbi:hypothetical protein DAI22_04g114950 [Oryza sativa Japonica Group]|nr:hypothetical protein DAI22_04g114950 [Oryza sativa Japonica Group]
MASHWHMHPPLLHHATLVSQGAEWPGQGGELADQIHAWCMHFCFALSFDGLLRGVTNSGRLGRRERFVKKAVRYACCYRPNF